MKTKISELLDCIQDDSVTLSDNGSDPTERIKARTMEKLGLDAAARVKKPASRRPRLWRTALIAAVVTAMLAGGVYAVQLYRLRNMIMPPPSYAEETDNNIISVVGYYDSPEYLAMTEWEEYLKEHPYEYEPSAPCVMPDISSAAMQAGAYDDASEAALLVIAEKYGLALHEQGADYITPEKLYEAVGVEPFIKYGSAVGYSYLDGTFHYDGGIMVNGKAIDYQFGRYVKGTFSNVALNVTDVESYEEWDYKTVCGVTVALALGPAKATVTANMTHSFVTVNILSGTEEAWLGGPDTLDKADVEAFADMFDFTKID